MHMRASMLNSRVWAIVAVVCAAWLLSHARVQAGDLKLRAGGEPRVAAHVSEGSQGSEWYGWQTLSIDLVSIGCIAFQAYSYSASLLVMGIGGYLVGAPIVHFLHRNILKGSISGTIRLLGAELFLAGLIDGLSNLDLDSDPAMPSQKRDTTGRAQVLAGLGCILLFSAPLVDAVMAQEAPRPQAAAWSVSPYLALTRGAAGVAMAGRF
jgi:hypothetical protein